MAKLLFVVHRYPPYSGGSEINTHRIASQAVREGHDVLVLSDTHQGDFEGVRVTSDRSVAFLEYDMIVVHGSCPTQDFVLGSDDVVSPIFYMLIEPPKTAFARDVAARNATWIGYGTTADYAYIQTLSPENQSKARPYVYGLTPDVRGTPGRIRSALGITTPFVAMSAGGYWPHKRFQELVHVFEQVNHPEWSLVLFGYDTQHGKIPVTNNDRIYTIVDAEPSDVYDAMRDANLYIMNSATEGYGLTLLEAMYNDLPWISRNIAAGRDLAALGGGISYETDEDLQKLLHNPPIFTPSFIEDARVYVEDHHMATHSLSSILVNLWTE